MNKTSVWSILIVCLTFLSTFIITAEYATLGYTWAYVTLGILGSMIAVAFSVMLMIITTWTNRTQDKRDQEEREQLIQLFDRLNEVMEEMRLVFLLEAVKRSEGENE